MAKVAVIGDTMIDVSIPVEIIGTCQENPHAFKIRRTEESLRCTPGGAGNVAQGFANLAHDVSLISIVNDDVVFDKSKGQKIDMHCSVKVRGSITKKTRYYTSHGLLLRHDEDEQTRTVDVAGLVRQSENTIAAADAIVLVDYGKGLLKSLFTPLDEGPLRQAIVFACKKGAVVVTTGPTPWGEYFDRKKPIIGIGNAKPFWGGHADSRLQAVLKLKQQLDLDEDAITVGTFGSAGSLGIAPCWPVTCGVMGQPVYGADPCGAGDAYLVGFVDGVLETFWHSDFVIESASQLSQLLDVWMTSGDKCGRLAVQRMGVVAVQPNDLD